MKKYLGLSLIGASLLISSSVNAATCKESNVTINLIRAVSGNYTDDKHKNTVELHHDTKSYCDLSTCSNKYRVIIEGSDKHIISAAYMAFAAGKKVDINIDTDLGVKYGICTVSYLTVQK